MTEIKISDELRGVTRLILTTEVAGVAASGGIASYVDEVLKMREPGTVAVLHIGRKGLCRNGFPILSDAEIEPQTRSIDDLTLRALMAVSALLPHLKSLKVIESQDYFGLLSRIAQAREAGLVDIPCLQVTCHGVHYYKALAYSGQ